MVKERVVKRKLSSKGHLYLAKHPELQSQCLKKERSKAFFKSKKGGVVMALRSSSLSQVNISEKTERERLVIAKEVVIKSLVPVVFSNVEDDKREKVFDEWYGKLLSLITGAEKEEKKQSQKVAFSQKKVVRMQPTQSKASAEGKATGKQIKKIWAIAHQLDYGKEDIERIAGETCNVSHLSELDKWQASKVIDSLIAKLGVEEIYG